MCSCLISETKRVEISMISAYMGCIISFDVCFIIRYSHSFFPSQYLISPHMRNFILQSTFPRTTEAIESRAERSNLKAKFSQYSTHSLVAIFLDAKLTLNFVVFYFDFQPDSHTAVKCLWPFHHKMSKYICCYALNFDCLGMGIDNKKHKIIFLFSLHRNFFLHNPLH